MQVSYRNTLDHLVALQKFVLRHTAFGRRMMMHRFIMVEIILLLICLMFSVNHDRFVVFLIFLFLSGIAWLFRERAVLMQFKKDFKREDSRDDSGTFHKQRVLSIAPDGFRIRLGNAEQVYGWDEVDRIDLDSRYIYIVLKGVLHHVIPLAAFDDREAVDRFVSAMNTYCQAA